MPLGDVLTSPLESVLLDLGEQGATGCLYAYDQQGDQAEVYFRDGLVYSVYVPGERPMLGARLMSSGVLTPESLAEALEIQRTELRDWRLGELLVYLGFVDREVVEAFVEEQLCDMTADLLGWQVESWKFRKNRRARQDVAPPRSVQPLLDELQERVARWRQLSDSVGGMDAIPMLSAAGAPSDDVVIGPGEWALLCKVDGERSIAPVHVAGRSQSRAPLETVTTFRIEFAESWAGPDSCPIVIPANPGCSGWTTGSCSFAAALIISVIRAMSAPSAGVRRSPNASADAIT